MNIEENNEVLTVQDDVEADALVKVEEVDDANLAGNLTTLGNSFIAFVGAGILDLPYAFSKVGLGLGTVIMLFVACICLHCMYLLIDCKLFLERQGKKILGYGDIGLHAYGTVGARLVDFSLVLTQFGFCTAYFILISSSLHRVLEGSPGSVPFIWLCVPGQLMLSTLRHLKYLGKFSIIADITMSFAITTVLYYCSKEIAGLTPEKQERLEANASMGPYFFGACIYCFEGIGMVIPIQNAMRNKPQFKLVWGVNMVLVTALFWFVGWMGYKAYGVATRESIADNLPPFDSLPAMVQIAVSTGLYFTFPVMMFPVYQILESSCFPSVDASVGNAHTMALRFGVIFLSATIATFVPSFSSFVVLVGSSTCVLLAFIFPAIFSLKIRGCRPLDVAREGTIVVLGIVAACLGTRDALQNIFFS